MEELDYTELLPQPYIDITQSYPGNVLLDATELVVAKVADQFRINSADEQPGFVKNLKPQKANPHRTGKHPQYFL